MLMRYVKIDSIVEDGRHKGYSLDADPYLAVLPEILQYLPSGARAFASDRDHYNFFGRKCVKDLKLSRTLLIDARNHLSATFEFEPYQFKHDLGLVIYYDGVIEMSVSATESEEATLPGAKRLGYLQLDETLPHERGFSHEIQFTGGSLWIVARELSFEWRDILPAEGISA